MLIGVNTFGGLRNIVLHGILIPLQTGERDPLLNFSIFRIFETADATELKFYVHIEGWGFKNMQK